MARKTKDATKSTAVAKKPPTAVGSRAAQLAGRGLETITQQDVALPFLGVLQALSPQVQRGNERHIKGASPGDFFNTVTQELWTGYGEDGEDAAGVRVIPCFFEKVYNCWVPRDEGGGFRGSFPTRAEAEAAAAEDDLDVIDTANHYCLVEQGDGTWAEVVFSCTSTKLTMSRQWNSMMKQQKMIDEVTGERFTPPSFARTYRLTTGTKTNDKGTFFVPRVSPDEWVDDEELFDQGEGFYRMFAEQGVKVAYDNADVDIEVEKEEDDPEY